MGAVLVRWFPLLYIVRACAADGQFGMRIPLFECRFALSVAQSRKDGSNDTGYRFLIVCFRELGLTVPYKEAASIHNRGLFDGITRVKRIYKKK